VTLLKCLTTEICDEGEVRLDIDPVRLEAAKSHQSFDWEKFVSRFNFGLDEFEAIFRPGRRRRGPIFFLGRHEERVGGESFVCGCARGPSIIAKGGKEQKGEERRR